MLLLWLIALFIFLPWIELLLLFKLAEVIGGFETLLIIILTGIVGAALARWQGFRTITRIHAELNRGVLPAEAMLDALFILCAGLVLITPGLITDTVGFAILIPPVRKIIKKAAVGYIKQHFKVTQFGQFTAGRQQPNRQSNDENANNIIDVEAKEVDESSD